METTIDKNTTTGKRLLEVCTANLNSVKAAVAGGAKRIELCSALPLDGLTPSTGLLKKVRTMFPDLRIHVLIRPREGDFVYSEEELQVMEEDIRAALPWADGIVSGVLDMAGNVNIEATRRLVEAALGRPFTFHRAFDVCQNPLQTMEELINIGCARILTSGQAATAEAGIPLFHQLIQQANDRIIIMPGGGVTASNARRILQETGAKEIHGSVSMIQPNGQKETSAQMVRSLLAIVSE